MVYVVVVVVVGAVHCHWKPFVVVVVVNAVVAAVVVVIDCANGPPSWWHFLCVADTFPRPHRALESDSKSIDLCAIAAPPLASRDRRSQAPTHLL